MAEERHLERTHTSQHWLLRRNGRGVSGSFSNRAAALAAKDAYNANELEIVTTVITREIETLP